MDKIKFEINERDIDFLYSSSLLKSCWIKYFEKPASEIVSQKEVTIVAAVAIPKISGASKRANTIDETGDASFANISVTNVQIVALFVLAITSLFVILDILVNYILLILLKNILIFYYIIQNEKVISFINDFIM